MESVANGQRLDPARVGNPGAADAANAKDLEERRDCSVDELITELQQQLDERQELFSRLTDAHEDLRQDEYPITFGEFLSANPGGHVREHLAQLRTALERTGVLDGRRR